jgi:hypothetical protein
MDKPKDKDSIEEIINDKVSVQDTTRENPTTIEGICSTCSMKLIVPFPPILHFHHTCADMINIPHIHGITCGGCNTYYSIIITNVAVSLGLIQSEKPILNEDKKVIPFRNLNLIGKTH